VIVALVVVAILAIGGGAAACKLEFDCGIGPPGPTDASRLERARKQAGALAASLPHGFREQVVAGGFTYPTDFSFLPDGDVLVSVKNGVVYRVTPGRPGRHIVLDLRSRIDTFDFRGLVTVAVSPTFSRDHRIYALYVPKPVHAPQTATTVARFSSFVIGADGRASHERILVGSVTVPTCSRIPVTADCLSSDLDHNGAQVAFAKDGTIFLSTGDGGGYDNRLEPSAVAAQDPDALSGKVLHIDRNGRGLPGNPWWNGDPRANRSKVWAVGLRNPFRLTLDPRTSVPIVGDVGRRAFEEIDAAPRGANLGWPCWEGHIHNPVYAPTRMCAALYDEPSGSLTWPLVVLPHAVSATIVGGAFAPAGYPAPYGGAYFFGDWAKGWIRFVHIAPGDARVLGPSRIFATGIPGPVAIHVGPDGHLYYMSLNAGELCRLDLVQ